MPRCHSCGRETLRTEDWACQWCGYPLPSGPYGKIEKTYRQLKEERLRGIEEEPALAPELEVAAEFEEAVEVEPEEEQPEEIEAKEETARETEECIEEEEEIKPEAEQEIKPEESAPDEAEAVIEPEPEPKVEVEEEPKPEAAEETGVEPEPELEPVNMEIKVTEMFEAYQEDDAAADKRFVGKVIKMTGVISMIDIKSVSDMHYIRLTGNEKDLMQSVKCMFGKQHAQSLMRLEKGQTVTVQGRYDGSIIAMRMVNCALVE